HRARRSRERLRAVPETRRPRDEYRSRSGARPRDRPRVRRGDARHDRPRRHTGRRAHRGCLTATCPRIGESGMSRLLVVDDEPQLLRALVLNLTSRGYEVSTAATAAVAVAQVRRLPPDLLLLD